MRQVIILVLATLLLTGCFGGGEVVPQDRFYHLADLSGDVPHLDKHFGVVAVSSIRSDALHQERTILYSRQSSPLMVSTYFYHQWTNTPGQMIQESLISYLRQANLAGNVVRYGEREHIDAQINGYLHRFERIVGNGKPSVIVRLELSFIPRGKTHTRGFTHVYHEERQAADSTMETTVVAFSAALQAIYKRFVMDVQQHSVNP